MVNAHPSRSGYLGQKRFPNPSSPTASPAGSARTILCIVLFLDEACESLRSTMLRVVRSLGYPRPVYLPSGERTTLDASPLRNYIVIMKTNLVRIGNSRGIRIPKPVIEQ